MTTVAQSLRRWRSRGLVLVTVCASAVTLSNLVVPGATAAPAPVATMVKSVVVSGLAAPVGAPNNPSAVIVANTGFSVTVTFSDADGNELPPSWTKDSTVTLTVEPPATGAGGAQFVGQKTLVVPAGAATATASGLRLSPADNRISIGATVTGGSKEAKAIPKGFSAQFDVSISAVASDTNDQTFLSTSGGATECSPTTASPYCLDLHLPFGSETGSLLTVGKCDSFLGCSSTNQRVIQALADLSDLGYSNTSPAVAVYKCDKTACPGGGVPTYHVSVNLAATGPLSVAPACSAKGVVDAGLDYCVDYRQSKRDNAGDLHLYLLLARDARMSCC